ERLLLLVVMVRRMVRRDDIEGPVTNTFDYRCTILGARRWRVDLRFRAVLLARLVGECEVVRGPLGGDGYASCLRVPDHRDAHARRNVLDVEPATRQLGEQQVARDHDVL